MGGERLWNQEELGEYPALRGPHKADVVVVGGGYTGMTTALWLCRAGLRVVLLEAETLGCGATCRCAGMLSLTDRLLAEKLEKQRGQEVCSAYIRSLTASFGAIRTLAAEAPDGFDWQDADAGIVAGHRHTRLAGEAEALRRAGAAAQAEEHRPSPLPCAEVLTLRNMATMHPFLYFRYLTQTAVGLGLKIYEHSRVTALETNLAQTEQGIVTAPYLVIATGYPIVNVPGWYVLRLWQRRRALLRLGEKPELEGMFFDANGRYALRKWQDGMLLALDGGSIGKRRGEDVLATYAHSYAPYLGNGEPLERSEGLVTISADGLPYIGAYSRKTPNLFVATGYGGKGLLGSMTAARLISARVLGLTEDSAHVFSAQRSGNSVLGREIASAAAMAGRYLFSMTHPFAPRCPHMGCKLSYSRSRRIWECPCHGSRFDDIGHLLNAPSVEDAIIRRKRQ